MSRFDEVYTSWMEKHIAEAANGRRREILQKGLSRGSVDFLQYIWFPVIGHLDHLYPEYEIRDFNNGYRYLDFAYMPGNAKGCIEIQDYRSHARDIEVSRFKGLGEMPPAQLKETTMDPSKRVLLRVEIPDAMNPDQRTDAKATAKLVEQLMGRKPEERFKFIQERAQFAGELDI